jgi:hypothetical protein
MNLISQNVANQTPMIRVKHKKPFFFPILAKKFGVKFEDVAIAFGRTIYTPVDLPYPIHQHELVHILRQKSSYFHAIFWWIKYIRDPQFRFDEELIAYRRQYNIFANLKENYHNYHRKDQYLNNIAEMLSGEMYGKLVTFQEAKRLIKNN